MVGSLLSAAFVICVYMAVVGFLVVKSDSTQWKADNLTPLVILAPILFLLQRQLSGIEQSRDAARRNGRSMSIGGASCGIATLIVAAVMPQLPAAIIMFVIAWGTLLITLVLLLKGR